jgi:hypothetical protein
LPRWERSAASSDSVSQLPLGRRQIVEITKALFIKPRVLIFDEPTSSLAALTSRCWSASFLRPPRLGAAHHAAAGCIRPPTLSEFLAGAHPTAAVLRSLILGCLILGMLPLSGRDQSR